ncbi:YtnP family quorum-quenching lactonase [Bacillus sp. FJAT-45037]|uniref:YtnP family quorum-quenching lactonase n=1 Tax=Bacillus sp. FJAT-45037 TaxID=2011007 RepID=UPI000C24145A|nr:MBL fold metallo-hydrolase [Bacillus sp. FJAT-45037]
MEELLRDDLKMTWLQGGVTHMDGGAMFGVVPKPLWSQKYPHNESNQIELRADPILLEKDGKNILIEAGIGQGRFTEKQKRNYGIKEESTVEKDLEKLGITTGDIDIVLMTHMHFDHATGLAKEKNGELIPTFENATVYTSAIEWNEMRNPNIRSKNTYWEQNWKPIEHQVKTFEKEIEVIPGLRLIHTGGHSDGHSILVLEHQGETFVHLADIMPTHAHANPLWVLAYDDFPMDSIYSKEKWQKYAKEHDAWFFFYHDCKYRAVKWDENGQLVDSIERKQYVYSNE